MPNHVWVVFIWFLPYGLHYMMLLDPHDLVNSGHMSPCVNSLLSAVFICYTLITSSVFM